MRLIRKLSFRRRSKQQLECEPNVFRLNNNKENVQSSIKVTESEFSRYIQFNRCLMQNSATMPVLDSSYQLIDIKLRNHFEPIQSDNRNNIPQIHSGHYRQSSFECKEMLDMNHIYDVVGQPSSSIVNHDNDDDYHHLRTRIRTNPWYNSRSGLNNIKQQPDHHYEYIDYRQYSQNVHQPMLTQKNLSTFDRPIPPPTPIIKTNDRLTDNPYEQLTSNFNQMEKENLTINKRLFHSRKKLIAAINNNQNKRQINDHHHRNQPSPYQMKFAATNDVCSKRKFIDESKDDTSSPIKRRKNNVPPTSPASPIRKRSRKIDRLKSELKEIVHVALREALNEKDSNILL